MSEKKRLIDPLSLAVRDNVPAGGAISLADLPAPVSFASLFRDELAARGLGFPKEKRGGRADVG